MQRAGLSCGAETPTLGVGVAGVPRVSAAVSGLSPSPSGCSVKPLHCHKAKISVLSMQEAQFGPPGGKTVRRAPDPVPTSVRAPRSQHRRPWGPTELCSWTALCSVGCFQRDPGPHPRDAPTPPPASVVTMKHGSRLCQMSPGSSITPVENRCLWAFRSAPRTVGGKTPCCTGPGAHGPWSPPPQPRRTNCVLVLK